MKIKGARLYFFTGKGGVGKTVLSLSAAHYGQNIQKTSGKKVCYFTITDDDGPSHAKNLNIKAEKLHIYQQAQGYLERKLNQKKIAEWVVSLNLFRGIIGTLKGFQYVIFVGHIIQWLEKNPEYVGVFDAPSTGHFLSLFDAQWNFKSIFKRGLLYGDIKHIIARLQDPQFTKINIISRASKLPFTESQELYAHLAQGKIKEEAIKIFCNYTFLANPKIVQFSQECHLPLHLKKQMAEEVELKKIDPQKSLVEIPYSLKTQTLPLIYDLSQYGEKLLW